MKMIPGQVVRERAVEVRDALRAQHAKEGNELQIAIIHFDSLALDNNPNAAAADLARATSQAAAKLGGAE